MSLSASTSEVLKISVGFDFFLDFTLHFLLNFGWSVISGSDSGSEEDEVAALHRLAILTFIVDCGEGGTMPSFSASFTGLKVYHLLNLPSD